MVLAYEQQWGSLPHVVIASFLYAFGAGWLLVPFAFFRAPRFVRQAALFLIPLLITLPLATDWVRILAFGLPFLALLLAALPWRIGEGSLFVLLQGMALFWLNFPPPIPGRAPLVLLLLIGSLIVARLVVCRRP